MSKERGLGPTHLEAAYMAKHIYGAKDKDYNLGANFGDWDLIDFHTNNQGLKIGIYYKVVDGMKSYAVVNAGSESDIIGNFSGVWNDWVNNNATQPFGYSLDMKDSIAYARKFVAKHPDAHITFIGHSKGGAEAVANAVATNKDAIVFNPATAALDKYSLSTEGYDGNITSYVVQGEMLDSLSGALGKNIGTEILLKSPYNYDAPQLDTQHLVAQDPAAQAGQQIAAYINSFVYSVIGSIKKHSMDLVIELLGGKT